MSQYIDPTIPLQASNIDQQGNVLFLDEERLARKKVGFPKWKNRSNGLGIYNFLKEKILRMDNKRWGFARRLYRIFTKYGVWFEENGWKGKMYKKAIMLYPPQRGHHRGERKGGHPHRDAESLPQRGLLHRRYGHLPVP